MTDGEVVPKIPIDPGWKPGSLARRHILQLDMRRHTDVPGGDLPCVSIVNPPDLGDCLSPFPPDFLLIYIRGFAVEKNQSRVTQQTSRALGHSGSLQDAEHRIKDEPLREGDDRTADHSGNGGKGSCGHMQEGTLGVDVLIVVAVVGPTQTIRARRCFGRWGLAAPWPCG